MSDCGSCGKTLPQGADYFDNNDDDPQCYMRWCQECEDKFQYSFESQEAIREDYQQERMLYHGPN